MGWNFMKIVRLLNLKFQMLFNVVDFLLVNKLKGKGSQTYPQVTIMHGQVVCWKLVRVKDGNGGRE
jgi:hypothetical protein